MSVDTYRVELALRRWSATVATKAARETVALAKADPQVPRGKTGKLVATIREDRSVRPTSVDARARIVARSIQAATTDKGARPHVIRPRRRGLLVFHWPKAGHTVFLRQVNHPGNRPGHWWRPVVLRSWRMGLLRAAQRTRL